MAIEGGEPAGMDHHDVPPVAAQSARVPGACHSEVVDDAAVRRMNGGAVVSRDVEAAVEVVAGTAGVVRVARVTWGGASPGGDPVDPPHPLARVTRPGGLPPH